MRTIMRALFWLAALPLAAGAQAPDRIFVNGTVLTMDARGTAAEAVAVGAGRILRVGSSAEIRKLAGPAAAVEDLAGRTLLPGFYAAHDHLPQAGVVALFQVDLNSPPIGSIGSVEDIVQALRKRAEQTPPGEWIAGRGYDDTLIRERRHPNRQDLDRASSRHPIVITHTSGHLNVGNTRALALAGVTKDTLQPKGGAVRKDHATGEPTGLIEESHIVQKHAPALTAAERRRVVSIMGAAARPAVKGGAAPPVLVERLRIGAGKIRQDGSLQGYTGYLTAPYHIQPEGKQDFRGYPARSREELARMVKRLHKAGFQLATHGNGDAAIDDILHAFAEAQREAPRAGARHRIEHRQTPREDQLALKRGLRFTLHNETPVTPVDPLLLVWAAVNRVTRGGQVLGRAERIPVRDALRAVTLDAAWRNFEENEKGSIEPGKLADFVVLDRNPLAVPACGIRDLKVLSTIIGGEAVFDRGGGRRIV